MHPDDVVTTQSKSDRASSGEDTTEFENRLRCGDGSYRWFRWSVKAEVADELLYCVASDVTERRAQDEMVDKLITDLEVTETVLMEDAAAAVAILELLKDLGVRLAVDDFGTGYSSLSYLKRFPVDVLKIDRSFVDGLGQDAEDTAIVAAIVSLAGAMQLDAVAEGVETCVQRAALLELGCARGQGYHFARPLPAADVEPLLDQRRLSSASRLTAV